jgi:hypothetical protein
VTGVRIENAKPSVTGRGRSGAIANDSFDDVTRRGTKTAVWTIRTVVADACLLWTVKG